MPDPSDKDLTSKKRDRSSISQDITNNAKDYTLSDTTLIESVVNLDSSDISIIGESGATLKTTTQDILFFNRIKKNSSYTMLNGF